LANLKVIQYFVVRANFKTLAGLKIARQPDSFQIMLGAKKKQVKKDGVFPKYSMAPIHRVRTVDEWVL
jgi:hypothetical protein